MRLRTSLLISQTPLTPLLPPWGHHLLREEGERVLVWSPDASGAGEPRLPGAARRGEPPRPAWRRAGRLPRLQHPFFLLPHLHQRHATIMVLLITKFK